MSSLPPASVIDASFGIKLVIEETHSEKVREYLRHLRDDPSYRVYVPDLFYSECGNILWKLIQRRELALATAEQHCKALLYMEFHITSSAELMARAIAIGVSYNVSAYDASYLALSEQLHLPLLTADNRLAMTMANSPYHVLALDSLFATS
jgi:predicted nucleic acid-binding protein